MLVLVIKTILNIQIVVVYLILTIRILYFILVCSIVVIIQPTFYVKS